MKRFHVALIILLFVPVLLLSDDSVQVQESNQSEQLVAELSRLSVSNNIVTVRLKIRNKGDKSEKMDFFFKDLYLIDEQNQKKYYVLKDSEGQCIAGPFSSASEGGRFEIWIEAGKIKNIWAKLPLPTDNPGHISLSIPGFLPFESIPLPEQE